MFVFVRIIGVPIVGWRTTCTPKEHVLVKRWPPIASCKTVELGLISFQGDSTHASGALITIFSDADSVNLCFIVGSIPFGGFPK